MVDNGAVFREVDLTGGHVRSASYRLLQSRQNFLRGDSREFSLLVDGRLLTVPDLAPDAQYAVMRLADGKPVARASGADLAQKGFRVEFDKPIDGELYEVSRR